MAKRARVRNGRLKAVRDARRWTQKELAKALERHAWDVMGEHQFACAVRKLQSWEAGVPPEKVAVRVLISCLGRTAAELGLEPDPEPLWIADVPSVTVLEGASVPPGLEDVVRRREFVTTVPAVFAMPALVGARRHVSMDDVAYVNDATRRLQVIDDQVGGASLPEVANHYLAQGYGLLAHAKPDKVGRALHSAVGKLAVSTGWFYLDAGNYTLARLYLNDALKQSQISEDPQLEADAYYRLAAEARDPRHPRPVHVLRYAQLGKRVAANAGQHRVVAKMHLNEARAYAMLGELEASRTAIGMAWNARSNASPSREADWNSCTEAGMRGDEAACLYEAGAYPEAAAAYERSLVAGPGGFTRDHAWRLASLALARLEHGAVDGACEAASTALDKGVASGWVIRKLGRFVKRLPAHDAPVAREFVERWRASRVMTSAGWGVSGDHVSGSRV